MPKGYCVGNTGDGKTLWASLYALIWAKKHPNGKIFANYHLNLPNAVYTRIMFLPFSELRECLIIYDDVATQEQIMRFSKVTANISRKNSIELIFTAQYKKMIPKQLRAMMDYKVKPRLYKSKDLLVAHIYKRGKGITKFAFPNAIKIVKELNLYDTNEIVDTPTHSEVIEEIIKISKSKRDIEKNLIYYTGNKKERQDLFKKIMKKTGIQDDDDQPDNENDQNNNIWYKFYILHKLKGIKQIDLESTFGYSQSKISKQIKKIDYEIKKLMTKLNS